VRVVVVVSTYETEKKERNEKWTTPPSPTCTLFSHVITMINRQLDLRYYNKVYKINKKTRYNQLRETYLSEKYVYLFCLDASYLNKFHDAYMEAKGKSNKSLR